MNANAYYIRCYINGKFQWAEYIPSFWRLVSIWSALEDITTHKVPGSCKLSLFRETVATCHSDMLDSVYTASGDDDHAREIIKKHLLNIE